MPSHIVSTFLEKNIELYMDQARFRPIKKFRDSMQWKWDRCRILI